MKGLLSTIVGGKAKQYTLVKGAVRRLAEWVRGKENVGITEY
jgi:hypothetical protein